MQRLLPFYLGSNSSLNSPRVDQFTVGPCRDAHLGLRGGQHVYDRFGMVAVVVLPDVGDRGEGRRRGRGEDGRDGVRLWRLQDLLLHVPLGLGAAESVRRSPDQTRLFDSAEAALWGKKIHF